MTQSIVPEQKKGAKSDSSYHVSTPSESKARKLYRHARLNLLNVNKWHSLIGAGVKFQVVNEKGEEINTHVGEGNYIRIRVAGIPHSKAGNGDEWVYVEKVEEEKLKHRESTAIRVRPAVPPFVDKNETAHFFADDATSSFCVVRDNIQITSSVLGRNEVPNTETRNPFRWIRNVFVALGAMLGLNKPIWKRLAKGIIEKKYSGLTA
jgi:hypothetical protein